MAVGTDVPCVERRSDRAEHARQRVIQRTLPCAGRVMPCDFRAIDTFDLCRRAGLTYKEGPERGRSAR